MQNKLRGSSQRMLLAEALGQLQKALELLDEADAPADIGAHVDLAICRLGERLQKEELRAEE